MKIGELARITGTQVETIRYYEREKLLPEPARTDGNYRVYGKAHGERLAFIRHCRALDMSLSEVRVLLRFKDSPSQDCSGVNALIDEQVDQVAARLKELRRLQRELLALQARCRVANDTAHCGILEGLSGTPHGDSGAVRGRTGRESALGA